LEVLETGYKLATLKRSTIAITSVVLVEVTIGFAVNSLAILSDGLHASLDALSTLILFVAMHVSTKPPDEEHTYGHEKFESIGGFVGGLALILIALLIIYEAIYKIMRGQSINTGLEYVGFIAIGYTFCIDFFRVGTFMKARTSESTTMRAGFYHAVADLGSTVIALLGFGLAAVGFYYGDSLSSMCLGVLLTYLSVKLVWSSGMELTDTISKDVSEKVRRRIIGTQGVCKLESLKIRKAGEKTFVRSTVQVPDYFGLEQAHALASSLETDIKNMIGNSDVVIHVEPSTSGVPTQRLVEKLAAEVEGVKEVYEVNTIYTDGKLYITLHACVDPESSIQNAHDIAERIEHRINEKLNEVEDITVHVAPFNSKIRKGAEVDDSEIRRLIQRIGENYQHAFRIVGILTYSDDRKRYINIDCSFTKQISIEAAHRIATEIEDSVMEHFAETEVMVHMEPS
jgi:cation diffusion facilitator family transporter